MADVVMEMGGKRKRVPADMVERFKSRGAVVVSEAPAAAPTAAPAPTMPSPAPEKPAPTVMDRLNQAGKAFGDLNTDAAQGIMRGMTLGLDDVVAGAGARLGDFVQRARESDDMMLAGGGQPLAESWKQSAPAYQEGVEGRRAEVNAAKARSPIATGAGEAAGLLATAPLNATGSLGRRIAFGAGQGAVSGMGMGDADTLGDAAGDAGFGAALGAGFAAAPTVGGALLKKAKGLPIRNVANTAADKLEKLVSSAEGANPLARAAAGVATGGGSEVALGGAKLLSKGLRTTPKATQSLVPEGGEDLALILQRLKGEGEAIPEATASLVPELPKENLKQVLKNLKSPSPSPSAPAAPAPAPTLPQAKPPISFLPAVEDVSKVGPAEIRAANESMTPMNLRRSVLGRRPTNDEMEAAVLAASKEVGPDVASIVNKTGLPTREVSERLQRLLRDSQARAGMAPAPGSAVRTAKEGAQNPLDNVSGRQRGQVAATKQQETWSRAFEATPPEQRAAYVQKLIADSGLPPDVIRQRLKLTKAQWRRFSFDRAGAE
jgi:hypothetical protein